MKKHTSLSISLALGVSTLATSMFAPVFADDTSLEPVTFSLAELQPESTTGLLAIAPEASTDPAQNTLPEVTVKSTKSTAKKSKDDEDSGYIPKTAQVGKTGEAAKDIPQSLTIIPQQLIQQQNAATLKDALKNVAGLTFNAGEGGRIGDNITLRGFSAQGDLYLDGLRDIGQYNRDSFNLNSVEVLRGSASMLYGQGDTAGVINQVSKMPMDKNQASINVTGGSYDYKRITMDVNRKLTDKLLFRLTAMDTDSNSYRNYVFDKRWGFAPTLTYNKGGKNEFTLAYYFEKEQYMPDFGVPFYKGRPLNVPVYQFYGLTNVNYQKNETNIATLSYIHRFGELSTWKTTIREGNYDWDLNAVDPQMIGNPISIVPSTPIKRMLVTSSGTSMARGAQLQTLTGQSEYNTKFNTGYFKHQFLAGTNYIWERNTGWNNTTPFNLPNATVGNPIVSPYLTNAYLNSFNRTGFSFFNDRMVGAYMQDTVRILPHLKLVGGIRYDHMFATYNSQTTGNIDQTFNMWSTRGGLLYQPKENATYYASYSTSYDPSAELNVLTAQTFKTPPQKSRNMEIGAKWALLSGKLSLRTAIFRTQMYNQRNTNTALNVAVLTGQTHTDGIELEAAGNLTKHWQIFASTALMHPLIDKAAFAQAATQGKLPNNVPKYMNGLWTTYSWKFHGGWMLGVGLDGMGRRFANTTNTNWVPAYQRLDAMLVYELKRCSIKLNMYNMLNAKYYDGLSGDHVVPGTSRTFQLSLGLKM